MSSTKVNFKETLKNEKQKLKELEKTIEDLLAEEIVDEILENRFTSYRDKVRQLENDNLLPKEELEMYLNKIAKLTLAKAKLKKKQTNGKCSTNITN